MSSDYISTGFHEDHHADFFDSGQPKLDNWLNKHAMPEQNSGKSRTHVWLDDGQMVLGYYSLLPTTIREEPNEPGLFRKLKPPSYRGNEVPGVLVGKLALDKSLQGKKLGMDLLADAYLNAYDAVRLIGGVFLVIEPMDDAPKLRTLYTEFGFKSYEGSTRLFLSFNDFNAGTPL